MKSEDKAPIVEEEILKSEQEDQAIYKSEE